MSQPRFECIHPNRAREAARPSACGTSFAGPIMEGNKMRRSIALVALVGALLAGPVFSIAGTPDRVAAATLVVPFFEVGIDVAAHPQDTLLVIWNAYTSDRFVHYHVWDIDGAAVFGGNLDLAGLEGWNTSMRDLIALQPAGVKTALTQGAFYRGFVTFDVVTVATALSPRQASYPFGTDNALEGYVYYVRLPQGSANGLSMIPIEYVGGGVDGYLRDFYQLDGREEIDVDARACAEQLAAGSPCTGDANHAVYRIHNRVFGSAALGGSTRVVVFAWTWGNTGGPSVICGMSCDTSYDYKLYDDVGALVVDSTITLDHVVNVIDIVPSTPGFLSIWNVPSYGSDTQIYAFSFNAASPGFNPALSWDAIFESFIEP